MISNRGQAVQTLVLERSEDCLDSRVLELRQKIHDEDYINSAIQRIAQVISRKLVERPDELKFRD
ncbi:MAG: hypothetical protein IIT58_05765 [Treponema sp.]|nr:hypothetical protein [Treponema sp.]